MSNESHTDTKAEIEKALIEQYLKERGYSLEMLKQLPARAAKYLMTEATKYAALKMEEIEARARLVEEIHESALPRK